MGNTWILDVLADLKTFAERNDLPQLADRLDDTALVAAAEIASATRGAPVAVFGESSDAGSNSRTAGAGG